MVLTTPLARTLAMAGWRVTVVGRRAWSGVWEHNPYAEFVSLESIVLEYPHGWQALSRWLHRLGPTHLLVPYYRPELFWTSLFSGLGNRYCQMGRILGRLTLHHCMRTRLLENPRYMGEVWQDFAEVVGVARQSSRPEIFLTQQERESIVRRLAEVLPGNEPLITISPFHGGNTCHLELRDYVKVVRQLQASRRCRVIIAGTQREREHWVGVAAELTTERVWISCGELTLRELFAVIGQSRFVVCGGTGPLHVASAVNTPAVAVMCANTHVGPHVWGNLVEGTVHLCPEAESCSRFDAAGVSNCGFRHGPKPEQIAQTVLDQLA